MPAHDGGPAHTGPASANLQGNRGRGMLSGAAWAMGIQIGVATQLRPVWRFSRSSVEFRLRMKCAHIHIEGLDRTVKALEHELADRLGLCKLLNRREHLAVDHDLSVVRLGAGSRGEVDALPGGRIGGRPSRTG